jgi:hypothetical protein
MSDFMVFGISAAVLVKLLVNVAKSLGIPSKFGLLVALVVGIGLAVANQFALQSPAFATWYQVVFGGVIAALVASELFNSGARADERNLLARQQLEVAITK